MHDITARAAAMPGSTRSPNFLKHQRWYPTIYDLRRGSKRRLPHFAFEYGDGGAGDDTFVFNGTADVGAGETVDGGPYLIDLGTLSAGSNYTLSLDTTSVSFSITPKAASVTPAAKSKTYGDADPELTGSLVGFLEADNVTATYSRAAGETVTGGVFERHHAESRIEFVHAGLEGPHDLQPVVGRQRELLGVIPGG